MQLGVEIEELLAMDRVAGSFPESPPDSLGTTVNSPLTEQRGRGGAIGLT